MTKKQCGISPSFTDSYLLFAPNFQQNWTHSSQTFEAALYRLLLKVQITDILFLIKAFTLILHSLFLWLNSVCWNTRQWNITAALIYRLHCMYLQSRAFSLLHTLQQSPEVIKMCCLINTLLSVARPDAFWVNLVWDDTVIMSGYKKVCRNLKPIWSAQKTKKM